LRYRHWRLNRPLRALARPLGALAHSLGIDSLPTLFNGEWIWVPPRTWQGLLVSYERYMARLLPGYLHEGDTFLDVGASFGAWSLYAAALVGASGRVVACEPAPEAYRLLAQSTKRYKGLTPLQVGLGNSDEIASFAAQGTSECSSFCRAVTLKTRHWQPRIPITDIPVQMRRLDSIVHELQLSPAAIKIDVEGFELEVLRGAERTLADHGCPLFIEVHPYQLRLSGGSEDLLQDLLARHGYACTVINRNPNSLYTLLATKQAAA
jgi:FkbM family methyltransferase